MALYTECSRIRLADTTLTLQRNISLFVTNNQLKVTMRSFKNFSNFGPCCYSHISRLLNTDLQIATQSFSAINLGKVTLRTPGISSMEDW